ncbi:MAG: DNA polymerase IV [Planctomycetota bacterium]|jgi:DNA polymerase-4
MGGDRAIIHVDMDAFFASIEQLDRHSFRGKPLLVGGDGPRGVVAAASYEARAFGCRSALPMAVAKRRCPHAIVVRPRPKRYREVSRAVLVILDRFAPLVEPVSIDEAFLDVTDSRRLHGPPRGIAAQIKERIRGETGLTASVGVAPNKFLAKLASDLEKPDGLVVIEADAILEVTAPLPIGKMWGVGPATEARLQRLGVKTFGDLHGWPVEALESNFGSFGRKLWKLVRGEDDRPVAPTREAKSISQEQTFGVDLADASAVRGVLLEQAGVVAGRLRADRLKARTVTVKIRFGDYETITRSATLDEPTDRTDVIGQAVGALFDRWAESSFAPVRLIGAGASHLAPEGAQLTLFTHETDERRHRLDETTDEIRTRFGPAAIHRGASRVERSRG